MTKICNICKNPLMAKLTKNEIGDKYEYETFKYETIGGKLKTIYCCLVCQMDRDEEVRDDNI